MSQIVIQAEKMGKQYHIGRKENGHRRIASYHPRICGHFTTRQTHAG
jgi:hypothetical protein